MISTDTLRTYVSLALAVMLVLGVLVALALGKVSGSDAALVLSTGLPILMGLHKVVAPGKGDSQ